ncbi:hypothetical protein LOCC1_G007977 [Lachnellula occidentalis]|uniref:AB hydrolase-1 domain-containing protein n=1 Tax=Lachnellula occidentalis TaxID=215460 RepID=A0A8H8RIC3_9HELO|nr:hypothetical protein LOCC1_G007977 [Lachnellula occidentalis]
MAAIHKPTILFIHGSWHNPNHFKSIRTLFESAGFPTECPPQATINAKPHTTLTLQDDVQVIQAALSNLIEDDKDIIVVMHSYGGVLGSEAVHEKFGKKVRQEKGLTGGVTQLLYLTAFILPLGASITTTLGQLPPFIKVEDNGLCMIQGADNLFYNDISKEDQDHYMSELAPVPTVTQTATPTYAAYQHYPSSYLYCSGDAALPLFVQEMMVNGSGANFKKETCTAGHSPFLSQPQVVLDIIKNMVV